MATGVEAALRKTPEQTFDDTIQVQEVLLDVLVTDRDGHVILGLTEDDFLVQEDGPEVELSGLTFYSNRTPLSQDRGQEKERPTEPPAHRYFLFFFDDVRDLGQNQQPYVRRLFDAARKSREWVRDEMLPEDWVAVASYDFKLKLHQDFTRDRDALDKALEGAARGKEPPETWPSREDQGEAATPRLRTSLPRGKELRKATPRIEDALRLLAEAMSGIPGRKSLLLFSIGFGRDDGTAPYARPDQRYYRPMIQALNTHNVAVYPLDLTPQHLEHLQSEFLRGLAQESGGDYFQRPVSFLGPLRKIADENNGYYLLSYQATHEAGTSGYQEVSVTVRNPELVVRARKGYRYGD
jgi:VWFA-related protein